MKLRKEIATNRIFGRLKEWVVFRQPIAKLDLSFYSKHSLLQDKFDSHRRDLLLNDHGDGDRAVRTDQNKKSLKTRFQRSIHSVHNDAPDHHLYNANHEIQMQK